jgi:hypothetical protein
MNNRKIVQTVTNNVQKALGRSLVELEHDYIKGQSEQFMSKNHDQSLLKTSFPIFMNLLITDLKNPKNIHQALAEPHSIDIHEMLKTEIGGISEASVDKFHIDKTLELPNPSRDISTIFGTTDPKKLLQIFNPLATISTAYIVLDRKKQIRTPYSTSSFSWNLSIQGTGYDPETTVVTTAPLKNISGIKMYPFKFPNTESTFTFSERLSVAIEELRTQSYVSSDNLKRFHFLFNVTRTGDVGSSEPYELSDVGQNITEFLFYKPIQEITTITLTFGNPFNRLQLDPDMLDATISSAGVQTLITFSQPHFLIVGNTISTTEFNTDQPVVDYVEIAQMNDSDGWVVVTPITSTSITIDVDISGLTGNINSNPTSIYLESKRFVIPMEFKFKN